MQIKFEDCANSAEGKHLALSEDLTKKGLPKKAARLQNPKINLYSVRLKNPPIKERRNRTIKM